MVNPDREQPDEDPTPEESTRPRFLPFFAWPLLVSAITFDYWVTQVAQTPFRPYASFIIGLFLTAWFLIAQWRRRR